MAITQKAHAKSAVKHLVRQLAAISNPQKGYQTVAEVDSEISSLLLQGYRIVNTHYLKSQVDPENGIEYIGILYVLQLNQSDIERMMRVEPEKE